MTTPPPLLSFGGQRASTIVMVCMTTDDGGIETLAYRMAKRYLETGYHVIVLSTKKGRMHAPLAQIGCTILYDFDILSQFASAARVARKVSRYADKLASVIATPIEVFHGFCGTTSYLALALAARFRSTATAGIFHPEGYLQANNRETMLHLLSAFAARGTLHSVNSPCIENHERAFGRVFARRIIPLPMEVGDFSYRPRSNRFNIFSVGRIADFKTYNVYMLDVISSLKEQFPTVHYTIFGDGPLVGEVRRRISALALEHTVTIVPHIDYEAIPSLIENYDIHVGMGTAALDVARLGMPSLIAAPFTHSPIAQGFLHEIPVSTLGEVPGDRGALEIENELRLFFCSSDREDIGRRCLEYVRRYYGVDTAMEMLGALSRGMPPAQASELPTWRPILEKSGPGLYATVSARFPNLRHLSARVRRLIAFNS